MTPKEKAKELIDKYNPYCYHEKNQCASIVVDEVLNYSKAHGFIQLTEYWKEVKQEIEKL